MERKVVIDVILIVGIPTVSILSSTYSVLYGDSITIECSITASPAHNSVTWQKINSGITSTINFGNSAKYSGGSKSTPSLTILNTVTTDSGSYRCSATNIVGTGSSQDTSLTVTGGRSRVDCVYHISYVIFYDRKT